MGDALIIKSNLEDICRVCRDPWGELEDHFLLGAVDLEDKVFMAATIFRISEREFCGKNTKSCATVRCQG